MNSIIVTGANRGLGKEIHDLLVDKRIAQANCYFTSRKPIESPEKCFKYFIIDFGKINISAFEIEIDSPDDVVIYINNAGTIEPIGKAQDVTLSNLEYALRVNCTGPLAFAQDLVIQTKRIGARLFILNISSGAARHPVDGWLAYCVSKAAALMAFDVLASENDHVEIEHFDPGVMDTDMQSFIRTQLPDIMPDVEKFRDLRDKHILKSPQEIALKVISIIKSVIR